MTGCTGTVRAATAWAAIEAPSGLGLRPSGVERLPGALRKTGLLDALGAPVAEALDAPERTLVVDARSGILHAPEIARFSEALSEAVGRVLDAGQLPLVLGGDCSILLGNALALSRRGRFGLLFLDGHADFYQPDAEPAGEAASMDLALVTGHGPDLLEQGASLIRPEDVVAFGFRDGEESEREGSQPLADEILALDLATIRSIGLEEAANRAIAHLTREDGPDRFWVHVDADVLDDSVMPAVDYRLPGGLTPGELATVLRGAAATGRMAGAEVTIYNPALDPDGSAGAVLAHSLAQGLA